MARVSCSIGDSPGPVPVEKPAPRCCIVRPGDQAPGHRLDGISGRRPAVEPGVLPGELRLDLAAAGFVEVTVRQRDPNIVPLSDVSKLRAAFECNPVAGSSGLFQNRAAFSLHLIER